MFNIRSTGKAFLDTPIGKVLVSILILVIFLNVFGVMEIKLGTSGLILFEGLEVYSDPGLTETLSSIDWGSLRPGEKVDRTIYLKNGTPGRIVLGYSLEAWDPPGASQYFAFSWDYTETDIYSGESVAIVLSLEVLPEIEGITAFSFDIVIGGL